MLRIKYDREAVMKADIASVLIAILERLDQLEIEVTKLRRQREIDHPHAAT